MIEEITNCCNKCGGTLGDRKIVKSISVEANQTFVVTELWLNCMYCEYNLEPNLTLLSVDKLEL